MVFFLSYFILFFFPFQLFLKKNQSLGKWYLSQQGNSRPESWMQGKTRCPTCRAVFCLLDIVYINSPQSAPSNQNHED